MKKISAEVIKGFYYSIIDVEQQFCYLSVADAILGLSDSIDLRERDLSDEQIVFIFKAVIFDNPELFFININKTVIKDGTIYLKYLYTDEEQVNNIIKKIREWKRDVINERTKNLNPMENNILKILEYIYDYMTESIDYAFDELVGRTVEECDQSIFTVEGVITSKKAVCSGITAAMKCLLNKTGVTNYIVTGEADMMGYEKLPHSWNAIVYNGKTYYTDVTFGIINKNENWNLRDETNMIKHYFNSDLYDETYLGA